MAKTGRPTKLTKAIVVRICSVIRAGNYIETAAAHAGIHKDTLYDWLRQGATAESGVYREFSDAVEKALADAEVRDVKLIGEAAKSQWQAAAWRLERKFSDRWGRRTQQTNLNVPLEDLTDDQLARIAAGDDPIRVLATGRKSGGASS